MAVTVLVQIGIIESLCTLEQPIMDPDATPLCPVVCCRCGVSSSCLLEVVADEEGLLWTRLFFFVVVVRETVPVTSASTPSGL